MFYKKITKKLHKLLFPSYANEIGALRIKIVIIEDMQEELRQKIAQQEKIPKFSMADMMRDSLKLTTVDFTNISEDGIPKHFLDTTEKGKREQYVNQLHQIFQFEVWEVMCKNHIDTQGNFSFRTAGSFDEMLAGRFSVNGISLLLHDVKRGHDEYMERSKPPEDFDEFETTEGIIITKKEE